MTTLAAPKASRRRRARAGHALANLLGRSLLPFAALTIIAGTVLFGPWATLVLALAWWNVVTRIA